MDLREDDYRPRVRLTRARSHVSALAPVFGRAFVHEPMMRWPLGSDGDLAERFTQCFAYFLEAALPLGLVWEAGAAEGAAVWIPPEQSEAWESHPWNQPRILALADDGGRRYDAFWNWVATHETAEPSWQLDSIAVQAELQRRGIGRALIEAGVARARLDGARAFLSTGTAANVGIYCRCGFRVYDEADAPDGGPHIWFMRSDP
jgi:GNAT superfamily N-acetyltransferase